MNMKYLNGNGSWKWVAAVAVSLVFGGGGYLAGIRADRENQEQMRRQFEARTVAVDEASRERDKELSDRISAINVTLADWGSTQRSLIETIARDRAELLDALKRIDARLRELAKE